MPAKVGESTVSNGFVKLDIDPTKAKATTAVEDIVSFLVEAELRDKWEKTWRESNPPEAIRVTLTIMLHGSEVPLVFTTRPYAGQRL